MTEDIFNIGPILGKGYPEYDDNEPRDAKGRWTTGRGAGAKKPKGSAGGRGKTKTQAKAPAKKKPAAKPAAKPKSKPKAKPKEKPKEKAPPPKARKPRAKKPVEKPAEEPVTKPQEEAKPTQEAKPTEPSGLEQRDRARLQSFYDQYDALTNQVDQLTAKVNSIQDRMDSIYSQFGSARADSFKEHKLSFDYTALEGQLKAAKDQLARAQSSRMNVRSTIQDLEARLRGTTKRLLKALTFKQVLAKMTPNHGMPGPNDPLGLVFGWAIVCDEDKQPYFDSQGDHIPQDSMMKAAMDFMLSNRDLKVMHKGNRVGKVVFAWPVTDETSKAMGLGGSRTGLMIGVKPDNTKALEKFKQGEYTGFSIGGNRLIDEPVD